MAREVAHRALIMKVKRLLESPGTAGLPVTELANRVGCSVFHLSRTFRRSEGRTISAYRAELRLGRALQRLREAPDSDLTDLALECGYCSHSHLTASFRKALGTTPSAFAAGVRERGRPQPLSSALLHPGPRFCVGGR